MSKYVIKNINSGKTYEKTKREFDATMQNPLVAKHYTVVSEPKPKKEVKEPKEVKEAKETK